MNINERRKRVVQEELKHIEIVLRDILKDFLILDIETSSLYLILNNLIKLQKNFSNKRSVENSSNLIQFKDLKGGERL